MEALRFELLVWSGNRLVRRICFGVESTIPHTCVVSQQPEQRVTSDLVGDAVDRYAAWCHAQGKADRYVSQVRSTLARVSAGCGWRTLDDVRGAGPALEDYLTGLNATAKTRNNILCAVRAWAAWLVRREEIPENPFDRIGLTRHFAGPGSRALSPVEMDAMIRVAEEDEAKPPELRRSKSVRSPWYRLARATGLRALEMQRLRVGNLCLEPGRATVTVPAKVAKGRRIQRIPLADSVLPWLTAYVGARDPLDLLMMSPRPRKWVLDGDAKAANLGGLGQTIGLHSFRKGFVTALAASGAPMSVTQELARHTDPRLTQAVYVDAHLLPLRSAVNALAATGYGKSEESVVDRAGAADSMATSQQLMPTPQNIPEPRAAARESLAQAVVTNSLAGGLAVARASGFSCGGLSTEQAQDWARQDSNL